jgi:uncharacterized protein (UPF0276 family)
LLPEVRVPLPTRRPQRPAEAPCLGVGVGLRPVYSSEILERAGDPSLGIDFVEAISENFMVPGGRPRRVLGEVRRALPVVLHGVSLNVGSVDPLDAAYLDGLDTLARRVEPAWISDHLCWTGIGGHNLHDLLPLPCTEETLRHAASRILEVQERLGRRIALENVSSYAAFAHDGLAEWEFLVGVAEAADCGILLDVNNVFVSARNHGFDPLRYLAAIPPERVFQLHLAGHSVEGELLIDTHDHPVCAEVWALYEAALRRIGPVSTLIEWDDRFPPLATLQSEAARARAILERVTREWDAGAGTVARDAAAAPRAAHHLA